MIVTFIIVTILSTVKLIFGVLPNVPATPSSVVSAGSWITDTIGTMISFLNMVYSPALMAAIMVVVVGLFSFEWIYHTVMWIVRKIPIINIK